MGLLSNPSISGPPKSDDHPRLVIFDELGQQEIEAHSFEALLKWVSSNVDDTQQALIATSENLAIVRAAMANTTAKLVVFDDFILKPLA